MQKAILKLKFFNVLGKGLWFNQAPGEQGFQQITGRPGRVPDMCV